MNEETRCDDTEHKARLEGFDVCAKLLAEVLEERFTDLDGRRKKTLAKAKILRTRRDIDALRLCTARLSELQNVMDGLNTRLKAAEATLPVLNSETKEQP